VRRWPGIGPVAEQRLKKEGIVTLGQLLAKQQNSLATTVHRVVFGAAKSSLGHDRPAFREHDPAGLTLGSISNESTFAADVGELQRVQDQLCALTERVCWRARQRNVLARTVTLKLRYADFETLTRSRTIAPTTVEGAVFACIRKLFHSNYDRVRRVRLVGVCLSKLVSDKRQLTLPFAAEEGPKVSNAIDEVRGRFGFDAIHLGLRNG